MNTIIGMHSHWNTAIKHEVLDLKTQNEIFICTVTRARKGYVMESTTIPQHPGHSVYDYKSLHTTLFNTPLTIQIFMKCGSDCGCVVSAYLDMNRDDERRRLINTSGQAHWFKPEENERKRFSIRYHTPLLGRYGMWIGEGWVHPLVTPCPKCTKMWQ